MLSRRNFVRSLAEASAFAPFADSLFAAPDALPVMRVGFMSDTHIGETLESCARVKLAYGLFRERGVDLIAHLGDLADNYYPNGYRFYRQVQDEAYAGAEKPKELFVYAGHDLINCLGKGTGIDHKRLGESYELFRKALGIPNQPTGIVDFRGYKFVLVPEYINGRTHTLNYKDYERLVAEACAATPDRPVFVLDHEPPRGTIYDSYNWGKAERHEIFRRHPQVVSLSGHVHGSLHHDLNIWQGEYTAVSAGCLQYWGGLCAASTPKPKPSFDVLTMDVYADRLVFRRWDVRDRSEIDPEHPWIVPLPFAAATAPYAPSRRRAAAPVPAFRSDARLSVANEGVPFGGFRLRFPEVERAFQYRLEAQRRTADGDWKTFTWLEVFSEFWKSPKERTTTAEFLYRESYFEPSTDYRFVVSPVSEYGVRGKPIVAEARSPEKFATRTLLYEAKGADIVFYRKGWDGTNTRHVPDADGFYGPFKSDRNFIELPAGLFRGEPKTRFRLTLDMRTIQPENGNVWDLKFQDPTTERHCTERTPTPYGDSGDERYVMELVKWNLTTADTYHVCFSWNSPGRVKFGGLKLERL